MNKGTNPKLVGQNTFSWWLAWNCSPEPQPHFLVFVLWGECGKGLQRCTWTGLCSSRALWPLAPNFCTRATRKSFFFFQTNHMLGNVDFTGLEHWAPFNFLRELLWWIFFRLCPWGAQYFISLGYSCRPSGSHHGQNHCSLLKPKSNPKQIPGPKFTPPKIPCQITKP